MSIFWQWFFSIIGLVGFVMAFPFFLQLMFGQPRIGMSLDYDDTGKEGRTIKIYFANVRIDNPILKIFRVSRLTAQDVYFMVQVLDAVTKKPMIDGFIPDIAFSPSDVSGRITLPASNLNASVKLVKWQRDTNSANLICGNNLIPLQKGNYLFNIEIGYDDKSKKYKPCLLYVGETEKDLNWDERIMNKFYI